MRIGQHDGAGLRVYRFDLADAIVLLGERRQFMLADAVCGIGGDRRNRRETRLDVAVPSQAVDIVTGLVVTEQHAGGDHVPQILGGLGVDHAIVGVDCRRKIDLCLGNVQKAPRLALGALARFRAGENVVGRRENFGRAPRRRT